METQFVDYHGIIAPKTTVVTAVVDAWVCLKKKKKFDSIHCYQTNNFRSRSAHVPLVYVY